MRPPLALRGSVWCGVSLQPLRRSGWSAKSTPGLVHQEFTLRAFTIDGEREIVRQQFTFSPPGTTIQRGESATNLNAVSRLELVIIPAIDGGNAVATLKEWRIA